MHSAMRTPVAVASRVALCLLLALMLGCDDSSTDPSDTLVFEGQVTYQGESFHAMNLVEEGPIRITMARLDAVLLDITILNPDNLSISLGIGQEIEGECLESVQFPVREGELLFFNLVPQAYCLSIFDNGQLPEDSTLAYTVTVDLP